MAHLRIPIEAKPESAQGHLVPMEHETLKSIFRLRLSNKMVKKPKIIVDPRINETLQTGAVKNRTYRGAKVSIYF